MAVEFRLRTHLQALVGERHPWSSPAHLQQTAHYIGEQFANMGLAVTTHDFEALGGSYRNVIGVAHPPSELDQPVLPPLIVAAHYDTVLGSPGADDNGSALAVLLDVAQRITQIMRGKQRSRPVESIVAEAERLAAEGVKEINLISQDTINYGVDLGIRGGLTTLLRALVKVKDIHWIRPFYLYPQQVTDELLDLYAGEEKITKYIDMPLQHINDRMLKRMHRLGNRAAIDKLVDRIRTRIPGVAFRTAFIVGFPGETEQAYQELKTYVTEREFDRVAVFLYSDEEDTTALALDEKIERAVMDERRNELLAIQENIAAAQGQARIGSVIDVLVEGPSEETPLLLEGRHEGLAPEIDGVVYINDGTTNPGDLIKVEITEAATYDLVGHIVT
ncbi:MAG: MiaB/RimO family radical SAM methylthiotransferase [Nitrospira sp.]|nr:MiaB/RimO family radical SAM methylthiotransferase [Nitrospira sp.]